MSELGRISKIVINISTAEQRESKRVSTTHTTALDFGDVVKNT
jgi:hypothetical protein